ncbi:hypothetical protein KBC75_03905 [Candidatus Shapirobacteria bacterium]|nr:hypothetical protein [Candidatus Shapirobacteria bacterium]
MKKFFLVVLFLMMYPLPAQALDGGIGISPPFSNIVIRESEKQKKIAVKFVNNSNVLISLKLKVVDFGALDEAGGVAFLGFNKENLDKKYSLASWVNLSADYLNIDPKKTVEVEVTILNRESLSPGGHYGAVLATLEQSGVSGEEKVAVNQSYGSLFYVNKEGGEKFGMKFSQLVTSKLWWKLDNQVQLRLQNSGNVHLIPRGLVVIKDQKNREVARGIINSESAIILPETFRWFKFDLDSEKNLIMPGKYKLVVSYRYDGKNEFDNKETSFFYIGVEGVIFMLVGLISFIVLIWRRKNN